MKTVAAQLRAKLRLPAFGAPLFIVSNPDLCVAQCKSGVVGSFPALNARGSDDALDKWITDVKNRLDRENDAPFAVNQIVHRSNARLMHDMETIVKHEVPIVITSLGARPEINEAVHSYGGVVFHDVTTNAFAKKAVAKGADGASERGSSRGHLPCVRVALELGALLGRARELVLRAAQPRLELDVPARLEAHVAVDLQQKVFPAINTLSLSSGPAGSAAFRCIEPDALQVWMIRKCACSPVGRVISRQLQADAEAQALWLGCPLNQVVQCGREIWIPVCRLSLIHI